MADFVDVMLRKCGEGVAQVEATYRRDLASHDLSDELLYAIRSVVQDCQSALDSTASQVKDKYLKKAKWSPYFPLAKTPGEFPTEMEKQLKGLATTQPKVAAAFERHQPYRPEGTALGYLRALSKVNKHSDFSEQTRQEHRVFEQRVVSPGGGQAVVRLSGNARIVQGPGSRILVGGRPLGDPETSSIRVFVGWNFVNPPVPVLPTLQALVQQTRAAAEDIHAEAAL